MVTTSSCSLLLICRPRKDERLSWPSWLIYSGRFTHISGHPSAVGRAQDSESSPVKDRWATEPTITTEPTTVPFSNTMGGLLHLVERKGDRAWRGRSPPKPVLVVPNVTVRECAFLWIFANSRFSQILKLRMNFYLFFFIFFSFGKLSQIYASCRPKWNVNVAVQCLFKFQHVNHSTVVLLIDPIPIFSFFYFCYHSWWIKMFISLRRGYNTVFFAYSVCLLPRMTQHSSYPVTCSLNYRIRER